MVTEKKKDRSVTVSEPEDTDKPKSCFVIMPFGGWFDRYYQEIYHPAIKDTGLTCVRADDLYRPGTIIKDIWEMTNSAVMVIADVSTRNPNVLYELGLAHAVAKPVIILSETLEDIPFDLRSLRVLEYNKNIPDWGINLRLRLTKAIKDTLESPLTAVLPTFMDVDVRSTPKSASEYDLNMIEIKRILDFIANKILPSVWPKTIFNS